MLRSVNENIEIDEYKWAIFVSFNSTLSQLIVLNKVVDFAFIFYDY